jgi:hypothetical protein
MPAEIVNLRRVRKAKARSGREDKAAENRRVHGLTKIEREKIADERRRAEAHLRGHQRERPGDEEA